MKFTVTTPVGFTFDVKVATSIREDYVTQVLGDRGFTPEFCTSIAKAIVYLANEPLAASANVTFEPYGEYVVSKERA